MDVYIVRADIYCAKCAERMKADNPQGAGLHGSNWQFEDSDYWPQGPYANGGGEADSPQHCGACGLFLENPLTYYGMAYAREVMIRNAQSDVTHLWAQFYGIDIEAETRARLASAR